MAMSFLLINLALSAQTPPSREYQLKAVFLFNFTQFIEWPSASFDTDQSPMVIGILGENPFGSYLEETVAGEKTNGHPVIVHYYQNEEDAKSCHILFINLPESKKRNQAIAALKGKNILTVSDASDFSKQGGMIRFFTSNNKIKLQINLDASRSSELIFSSKLLGLAEIFKPGETNN
jgi:hypothetical protein